MDDPHVFLGGVDLAGGQTECEVASEAVFGRGHKVKRPPEPEVSSPSSEALGEEEGGGESAPVEENTAFALAVVCDEGAGASQSEAPPRASPFKVSTFLRCGHGVN